MAKKEEKMEIIDQVTMESVEQMLLDELSILSPQTDEYRKVAQNLAILKEADAKVKEADAKVPRVSPDTWVKAGVTLGSTLLLLAYERNNPITSKLLSFIPKPKL